MTGFKISVGDTVITATSTANALQVYNCLVDVVRVVKVNGSEGMTETSTTIVTSMPCTIEWKTGRERVLFDKDTYMLDAVLRCRKPAGVTIVATDRIVFNGETYEIIGRPVDVRNLGILLSINIKRTA